MRNTYAKSCYDQLQRQIKKIEFRNNTRKYNGFLVNICENLGFTCEHIRNKREGMINNIYFPFRMHFSNYLDVSSQFKDDNWKLINKYFGNGQVYLYQNDIEMLIREYVRMKTKPDYDKLPDPVIEDLRQVKEIAEIEEYVHEIIINRENRFQSSLIADDEVISRELFAPCIKAILYKLNHGENLGHNERLAIAFYYLNTNHSIEETVDLFRTSPDFDEGVARYQVEFAAGKRGKGTKYGMYGCSKMKSNRMCYANHPQFGDKLCVEGAFKRDGTNVSIHNPAGDYIFWKKVQLKRLHAAQRQAGEKIVEKEYEEKNQKNGNSKETKNYKNNKDKSNKANKSNRSIKKNHKNQRGKCGNTQERKIKKSGQNQKQKPGKNQGQKEGY